MEMKMQPAMLRLLNKRGINTEEEMGEFFSEKPQKTYDPFLLLNMEAGVDLILSYIKNGEKICVYGDYDADGITATSLLLEVLSHLTKNLTYYIPSRFDEGYGLNRGALGEIKRAGAGLVITVDCGSASFDEVRYAGRIGLGVIVTDHHIVRDKKADCLVINPKQPGCAYPFKGLAGVGVAFKLAQALAAKTGLGKRILNSTLDLVGIGTIGDIVPLVDENRTLAKYGLRAIRISERPGLCRLIENIGLDKGKTDSQSVAFGIVPYLNASGRIAAAGKGVRLMTSGNGAEAESIAAEMMAWNQERKRLQDETFSKCVDMVEKQYKGSSFYVIDMEDAHEGVTGIVAGKIKDLYHIPTVIVTPAEGNKLKGTGRSVEGVNLYELLNRESGLFESFGGHAAACGFTMKRENLEQLRAGLDLSMKKLLEQDPELLTPKTAADIHLEAGELTLELAEEMEKLEPFGCGNPRPAVSVDMTPWDLRRTGDREQYCSFTGVLENGREIRCMIFSFNEKYEEILQNGEEISIIGVPRIHEWKGKRYLRLNVLDAEKLR